METTMVAIESASSPDKDSGHRTDITAAISTAELRKVSAQTCYRDGRFRSKINAKGEKAGKRVG